MKAKYRVYMYAFITIEWNGDRHIDLKSYCLQYIFSCQTTNISIPGSPNNIPIFYHLSLSYFIFNRNNNFMLYSAKISIILPLPP